MTCNICAKANCIGECEPKVKPQEKLRTYGTPFCKQDNEPKTVRDKYGYILADCQTAVDADAIIDALNKAHPCRDVALKPSASGMGAVPWGAAQRVCDMPDVDEAIRNLIADNTGDNATCLVRLIMEKQQVEIERYRRGMEAWRSTAEQKDRAVAPLIEALKHIEQGHDRPHEVAGKALQAMVDTPMMRSLDDIIDWLDALHEVTPEGVITNQKWPVAQQVLAAILGSAELSDRVADLETALRDVVAVADRETDPFIRARALLKESS